MDKNKIGIDKVLEDIDDKKRYIFKGKELRRYVFLSIKQAFEERRIKEKDLDYLLGCIKGGTKLHTEEEKNRIFDVRNKIIQDQKVAEDKFLGI